MAYQLLMKTSLADFYPESIGGVKLTSCHGLITRLIEDEVSPEAALFLAEPVMKDRANLIEWHTPLEGGPVSYQELEGPERDAAEDELCQRAGELAGLGARLTGSESEQRRLAGRLISRLAVTAAAAAAGASGVQKVFAVGGRPVLAVWGMLPAVTEAAWAAPLSTELTEKESAVVRRILAGERLREIFPREAPLPPPLPPPPPPYPPPYRQDFPSEAMAAPLPPPQAFARQPAPAPGSGILKGILAALGAFLLLLLLVFLLAPGFRKAALAVPQAFVAAPSDDRESSLRAELRALKERYAGLLAACSPESAARAETPVPGIPASLPGDSPEGPAKEAELQLPESGEWVGFLEGCWKSDAGLKAAASGQPIVYVYCFGSAGEAKVSVEVEGEPGSPGFSCAATGKAEFREGELLIQDGGAKCPAEAPDFSETRVLCSPGKGNKAQCLLQSKRGDPVETRFTYLGPNEG
ncbi:MAG: hypothetical protein LBW85_05085 [Deltaproteobacteria bacterium]|jgi:hypothetical protein|nr:hypothetical protein [Deltaproteobacteria bacterium]